MFLCNIKLLYRLCMLLYSIKFSCSIHVVLYVEFAENKRFISLSHPSVCVSKCFFSTGDRWR